MDYCFKISTLCWIILLCLVGKTEAQLSNNRTQDLPCFEKNFNLRIIMTVDSVNRKPLLNETQVNAILQKASKYFEPLCISFSSCETEVIENYSYNTLKSNIRAREAGVLYAYPRRINVFIVQNLSFTGECGFSYLDGYNTIRKSQIFIELQGDNCGDGPAEQMAHHMGRLLGLLPTNYGATLELVDGSNCEDAGDLICDTPADPYNSEALDPEDDPYNIGCEFVWSKRDANGQYYLPSMTNIMSPYNCKCEFTLQQYQKMAESYLGAEQTNY